MSKATKTTSLPHTRKAMPIQGGRRTVPARLRPSPLKPYADCPFQEADVELGELERLNEHHDLSAFDAGPTDTEGQAAWLQQHALVNDRRGFTRTFVITYAGTSRVAAFFGLSSASIEREALPRRLRQQGTPRTISATLIARLALDLPVQGQGLSRELMLAALGRAVQAQEHVASAFVVVDAAGEKAQRLYGHYQFTAIEDVRGRTTRMVLPMATAVERFQEP